MSTFCTPAIVAELRVIHYGSGIFDKDKIKPVTNDGWVKPKGGLWTSPINSQWGWRDWCACEQFRECKEEVSFTLRFKSGAKILIIDSYEDLIDLPLTSPEWSDRHKYPDFEAISKIADAIWLTEKGQERTRLTYPISLYGWDCETVLILNKECCYQV